MQTNINFMGARRITQVLSLVLLAVAIFSLATRGLNFGLDFTGGTLVEVGYEPAVPLQEVRAALEQSGFENSQVVNFGSESEVLVRLGQANTADLGDRVLATLREATQANVNLKRIEYVGPQVGEELREQGGLGLLVAILGVMLYVAVQFQFKFSLGAVAALIHDVVLTLGLFSLLQLDFDLTVLAALLAVIGYSLNDTIVVADRIRENFRMLRREEPEAVINRSLNQTLGRTVMTSLTTLLVLTSLFVFGGDIIHGFATALIFGVIVGTYSSIFVASGMLLTLKVTKEDLIVPVPENADVDSMP
ncbi:MAG: protein translocase subunit SecF [Gammaproteobacteria bacterium]|nr:protein translocase subunit SecF [Gammaproteobacteria bacterium]MBT8151076.1 protein translocase subunit SecF [Gammaproteobacteria bacterium]NND38336.1 protein translocase subunit SecF [Pseudomonadales bacterium]NNM12006.1 protein translocase subunit SecF [Pseudomonadales bacterium]RZV60166.1 MAG: protein translocase subunit SecF [Pseudomonadales bacterium]